MLTIWSQSLLLVWLNPAQSHFVVIAVCAKTKPLPSVLEMSDSILSASRSNIRRYMGRGFFLAAGKVEPFPEIQTLWHMSNAQLPGNI